MYANPNAASTTKATIEVVQKYGFGNKTDPYYCEWMEKKSN